MSIASVMENWSSGVLASHEKAIDYVVGQHQKMLGIDPTVFSEQERRDWYWEVIAYRDHVATAEMELQVRRGAGWETATLEESLARVSCVVENWVRDAEGIFNFTCRPGESRPIDPVMTPAYLAEQQRAAAQRAAEEAKRLAEQPAKDAALRLWVGAIGGGGFFLACSIGQSVADIPGAAGVGALVGFVFFLVMCVFAWLERDVYPAHPNAEIAVNAAMVGYAGYKMYEHHEQKQANRIADAIADRQKPQW